ncbi:MAG: YaiI/YqxD family protein [Holophagales bacterium]|nr:YaiI/YqxD family protein [Holophagales bacterium]
MKIYVDADACPVKGEIVRVAERHGLEVVLVANSWMRTPGGSTVSLQVVGKGLDSADDWIADRVQEHDIVVTADILLAARCLGAGASVLGTTGKLFTEDNIGDAVASRELLAELREYGEKVGGPAAMKKGDRSRFLHQLDEIIRSIQRLHDPEVEKA